MAKGNKPESEETILQGSPEETRVDNDRNAEEVKITAAPKKVRIHVTEDVDCYVSKINYKLNKDKDYSVPSDVAAILVNAEKAYRI